MKLDEVIEKLENNEDISYCEEDIIDFLEKWYNDDGVLIPANTPQLEKIYKKLKLSDGMSFLNIWYNYFKKEIC